MKKLIIPVILHSLLTTSGCAIIDAILGEGRVQEPVVNVESVNVGDVSFEALKLLFDINIENPNQLGITLSSFDYELLLNEKSFVRGDQPEGMQIEAEASNTVRVPISLTFRDIIESVQSVVDQDSSQYQFKSGFAFNLPVIGDVRIPVSRTGAIPVIKKPSLNIASFNIKNISFTGADAVLRLKLNNPNFFSFELKQLQYNFSIDGINVLRGTADKSITITQDDESTIEIPLSLNFVDFGQSIYRILRGEQDAQFRFTGSALFASSIDFFQNIPLDFDQSGALPLVR